MKFKKIIQLTIFITILFVFNGCFFTDLNKDETIVYEGKIFEDFDKSKPIDSVFIQGCSQKILVFLVEQNVIQRHLLIKMGLSLLL